MKYVELRDDPHSSHRYSFGMEKRGVFWHWYLYRDGVQTVRYGRLVILDDGRHTVAEGYGLTEGSCVRQAQRAHTMALFYDFQDNRGKIQL